MRKSASMDEPNHSVICGVPYSLKKCLDIYSVILFNSDLYIEFLMEKHLEFLFPHTFGQWAVYRLLMNVAEL